MTKFINWLVKSSANPDKVAMTVKGILLTWVAMIIFVGQAFHVSISQAWLTDVIQTISTLLGIILMAAGLTRKIYLSFKNGTNIVSVDTPGMSAQ